MFWQRAGSENLVNMFIREPMAVRVSSDNVELDDKWIERDFVSQGKIRLQSSVVACARATSHAPAQMTVALFCHPRWLADGNLHLIQLCLNNSVRGPKVE
jgi:hypothetical protein